MKAHCVYVYTIIMPLVLEHINMHIKTVVKYQVATQIALEIARTVMDLGSKITAHMQVSI